MTTMTANGIMSDAEAEIMFPSTKKDFGTFSVTAYLEGLREGRFTGQSPMYWAAWVLPNGMIQAVANHNDYRSTTGAGARVAATDGCVRLSLGRDYTFAGKTSVGGLGVEFKNSLTASQRRAILNLTEEWGYNEVIAECYDDEYGSLIEGGTFVSTRGLGNFLFKFEALAPAA